jgi:23S rRNA (cytosine1962-C5)-methyltransferase
MGSGTVTQVFVAIFSITGVLFAETASESDVKVPGPITNASVVVTAKGENRIRGGHPWVYRSDVADVRDVEPGIVVDVYGPRQRLLGRALFSDQSQITIRMLTHDAAPVDDAFWRGRLERAVRFRDTLGIDATAFRLVHGEADLLPSLIVDRYGDYLVMQTLSQGMDRLSGTITRLLVEITGAKGVLARNDPKVRQLEGLEQKVEVLHGEVPEGIVVREARVTYTVDPWRGQKTGLFLDQRENREAAARYAHGRALDCFSYNGGFALALASRCESVDALDVSADAVARITANAEANGFANVTAREANVFDELRHLERDGARYDIVVLDPPAFAKNKASIPNALAGYKEINLRALRLLNPGGYLVTCSCSYNVDEAMFAEAVFAASADAHIPVTVVEKRMQGRDHPVLLGVPETYYLKSFILRKLA